MLLSAPLAWTFGELGARFPDGGGVSAYVRRAFGTRAADAVGWIFCFAVPFGAPVASSFAGGYVADLLGGGSVTSFVTFLAIIAAVLTVNWLGLHVSGRAQLALAGALAVLLWLTGPPALLGLGVAAAAVAYRAWRDRVRTRIRSPGGRAPRRNRP